MTDYDFTELRRRFGDIETVEPIEEARIDHATEAERYLEWADNPNGRTDVAHMQGVLAQAHATLALVEQTAALVEQQRIANLIVLANGARAEYGNTGEQATGQFFLDLYQQIREGLGLS